MQILGLIFLLVQKLKSNEKGGISNVQGLRLGELSNEGKQDVSAPSKAETELPKAETLPPKVVEAVRVVVVAVEPQPTVTPAVEKKVEEPVIVKPAEPAAEVKKPTKGKRFYELFS
jgi:outer membrane biosynthesis protein TonB